MKSYFIALLMAMTCFALSALNVYYAFNSLTPDLNWATAVFCFGIGIFTSILGALGVMVSNMSIER